MNMESLVNIAPNNPNSKTKQKNIETPKLHKQSQRGDNF